MLLGCGISTTRRGPITGERLSSLYTGWGQLEGFLKFARLCKPFSGHPCMRYFAKRSSILLASSSSSTGL